MISYTSYRRYQPTCVKTIYVAIILQKEVKEYFGWSWRLQLWLCSLDIYIILFIPLYSLKLRLRWLSFQPNY